MALYWLNLVPCVLPAVWLARHGRCGTALFLLALTVAFVPLWSLPPVPVLAALVVALSIRALPYVSLSPGEEGR